MRVSIFNLSPISMNSGTCRVKPVSTVAGLVVLEAVSPLKPGSVAVTSSSTKFGASTLKGAPLKKRTVTLVFSLTKGMASST